MILYNDTLISLDVFRVHFICDLGACLGSCCTEGDFGAPLEVEEVNFLKEKLEKIKPFISPRALEYLETNDFYTVNENGEFDTACMEGRDCVFSFRSKGILRCSIEKAFSKKAINIKKPVSCHLYPIRLGKIKGELTTLNYSEWSICKPALAKGENAGRPLFRFLKEPLIRRFGESWYAEMENIYEELRKEDQLQ